MSYYEKIPVIIEAWEMTKNNIIEWISYSRNIFFNKLKKRLTNKYKYDIIII